MNRHVIVREIDRADAAVIDALGPIGTATVHEAIGRVGYVGPHLRPIQQDVKIAGSAVTVLSHPGDNMMIHAAVEMCQPGDVLVVVNTAPSTHGMFGDLLAGSLMQRGVRGLVIDAGVRDTMDLRQMGFPVWSQHVSCEGTVKNTPGSVNVPVVLGQRVTIDILATCAGLAAHAFLEVKEHMQASRAMPQEERLLVFRFAVEEIERLGDDFIVKAFHPFRG